MADKIFGAMLDCSRNAVMKPEEVKNFAGILKSFGYNALMLYTEDTYEVNGEPYFGYMRGRYTKEEIGEIDAYCNSIGVELIPCIQTLAHLENIFRWEEYIPINDTADILLAEEERTYALIDNMFSTLAETFTSRTAHIGMDEAHMLGLGKYLDQHGVKNRFDILLDHLNKVIEIAKKYGFKPIMWSDMFFRLANHGAYYGENVSVPDEVKKTTPPSVGLIYWDYYHDKKSIYKAMIDSHKQFNNEIWFAGGAWNWTGFAPSNSHTLKAMKPAMAACRECGVDNVFITMWGDDGKESSFYSLLPSLFAVRKFYDGAENMTEIKAQFKEITGEDFDALKLLDTKVGGNKDNFSSVVKHSLYSDPFNGFLDSTVKDGVAQEFKRYSRKFARLAKTSKYGYIFESQSALCDLLSVKYDLGVRLRAAYRSGDKEALAALSAEIKKAETKLDKFYYAFRNLWYKENKPHGFDVQDQRLGGLKMRLRSCRERLNAYLAGEIENIPELEEKLLDFYCGTQKDQKTCPVYNGWRQNVTVNKI